MLRRAAAGGADEAGGVGVVHHQQGVVFLRQRRDLLELGDVAVHAEYAVGGDEAGARVFRLFELRLQIVHVRVGVAVAPGFAQANAVDDGGVIQRVADDGVLFTQDGFEQPAVGVEAGAVKNGVVGAEEPRHRALQRLVQILGAADEAHRRHAESVVVQRFFCRRDDALVIGEPEIIVGAEVDHLSAAAHLDRSALGRGDHALVLVKTLAADCFQLVLNPRFAAVDHVQPLPQSHTTFPLCPFCIASKPTWKSSISIS